MQFRKAIASDLPFIWDILKQAISRRKKDGSNQWQDGYPNPSVIEGDIAKGCGYVLLEKKTIVGYGCIFVNQTVRGGKIAYIEDIICDNSYRKKGIGKSIMKQLFNFAK